MHFHIREKFLWTLFSFYFIKSNRILIRRDTRFLFLVMLTFWNGIKNAWQEMPSPARGDARVIIGAAQKAIRVRRHRVLRKFLFEVIRARKLHGLRSRMFMAISIADMSRKKERERERERENMAITMQVYAPEFRYLPRLPSVAAFSFRWPSSSFNLRSAYPYIIVRNELTATERIFAAFCI
jgi:hypothetical protein